MASDRRGRPDRLGWTLAWQTRHVVPLLGQPGALERLRDFWRSTRRMDDVLRTTRLTPSSLIVDVGAGMTTPVRWLPGSALALDPLAGPYRSISPLPLRRARYVSASGERLPLRDEAADLVICTNCIDHTVDPRRVMGELLRVAKTGGHVWFSCEINPPEKERNPGHPHALDRGAIERLVADFEIQARWEEPWRGVYGYLLGRGPFAAVELGFLLRKRGAR